MLVDWNVVIIHHQKFLMIVIASEISDINIQLSLLKLRSNRVCFVMSMKVLDLTLHMHVRFWRMSLWHYYALNIMNALKLPK